MQKLENVIAWWKRRQASRRRPPIKPWRRRLGLLHDYVTRPWKFLEYLKEETRTQVLINKKEEGWADWKTEEQLAAEREKEENDAKHGSSAGVLQPGSASARDAAGAALTSTPFSPSSTPGVTVKAWESDSEEEEEERNCKIACRLAVGHLGSAAKSSLKFDIAASKTGVGNGGALNVNAKQQSKLRPSTTPGTPSRPRSRAQTAASHIRLYGSDVLGGAFRTASTEWNLKVRFRGAFLFSHLLYIVYMVYIYIARLSNSKKYI